MGKSLIERLDPELSGPVKRMLALPGGLSLQDIPAARANSKKMMEALKKQAPLIHGVNSLDRQAPGPAGAPDVTVRIYQPQSRSVPLPALLWIHGGGYILGNLEQEDTTGKQLTLAGDCVTVSVEYRLAPEHPFPAPLEDCYAALKWLAVNADELGVDRSRIAVGGASAGGGLAAGLALLARDRGEVNLLFQLLIYPMLDDCNTRPASDTLPDSIFWTRECNLIGWRSYLGCEPGAEKLSPYAAAARATNLADLPPTYLAVGDLDLFASEDLDYGRRLMEAGIATELHVYPGACHGLDMLAPGAHISRRFRADYGLALKNALHG